MSFLDKFFGPSYEKELKRIRPLVAVINNKEEEVAKLTDTELKTANLALKDRLAAGETVDDILVDSFAYTREAAKRTLNIRHYDVQLIGGVILHEGKITEMRTGEGKTLVGTLPAALNALEGKGVHIVTVNDYLARRDAVWMGQIYHALGLSVGVINQSGSYLYDENHIDKQELTGADEERDETGSYKVVYEFLRPCTRQEAYAADVTYGTNSEYGFDYLRDNIEFDKNKLRQRGLHYAVVDEIDSILIDEARTPLIISAPASDSENLYEVFANIARQLKKDEHYVVDEKHRSADLNDAGIEEAERILGIDNIYTEKGIRYVHHLETAVKAKALYHLDKEYVVRDGEVVIVDEFTGRMQPGRRWSDGLHQAMEAKEGVQIQQESRTYASITYQNFFRMYDKLSGMTGTAMTSLEEFYTVYKLEVIPVPTNREIKRSDLNDFIFQNEKGKFAAIIKRVAEVHATGQPILIGTASIETNERLAAALTKAGIKHQVLNAKNHESEGEIIAAAGKKGAVTLATNMAGRGVDIKLGGPNATKEEEEEVRELGGLFVLGTERHEARRIDNQLRGRSGRQGDPGVTQFFVSMEDSLMRVFGGERVQSIMKTLRVPEDQPLEMKMITRQLEGAQTRIEGFHFDSRKQVLAYDDVLNQQRLVIYDRRHKLLVGDREEAETILSDMTEAHPEVTEVVEAKVAEFGEEEFWELFTRLALQTIDSIWVEHLEVMDHTRASVSLRAYGQRDPLVEYRAEGVRLFKELQDTILQRLVDILPQIQPQVVAQGDKELQKQAEQAQTVGTGNSGEGEGKKQRLATVTPGRNETVTITNGTDTKTMKYKKAEAFLGTGWWLVE